MGLFRKKSVQTNVQAADSAALETNSLESTDSLDSSLEATAVQETGALKLKPTVLDAYDLLRQRKQRRQRLLRYSGLGLVLVVGIVLFVLRLHAPHKDTSLTNSVQQRYGSLSVPSDKLSTVSGASSQISSGGSVSVNGLLNANGGLILAPTSQPTNPTLGQLYFDKATSQLAFYNGNNFNALAINTNVVSDIGGTKGSISLGNGLGFVNGKLTYTGPASVVTLQGQSGNVSLSAGDGIAIDGTTVSNAGVLSIGGQTGAISLGAGLTVAGSSLRNSGLISATAGSNITVVNDGNGNVTISANGGGTGNVSTAGGTTGTLALFNGAQSLGDSLLSQSGGAVSVGGNLAVTGSLTLGTALSVSQGGTGLSSFTANQLVYASGATSIGQIGTGNASECLISNGAGLAPSFQTCTGASGVSSVNGLNNGITIANAGTSGNTITINNAKADGLTKGIATFSSSQFADNGAGLVSVKGGGITTTEIADGTIAAADIANSTITGGKLANSTVANANLVNSTVTVTAGSGLGGGGSLALGGSTSLSVTYGAAAGTAVQGNVSLTCASGSGNLSGGGDVITLGNGGACSNINITSSPVFSGTLAVQGAGGITIGTNTVAGLLKIADGGTHYASFNLGAVLSTDQTYSLPTTGGTVCVLEAGNCTGGASGAITASGTHTQNFVPKFSNAGGSTVSNSLIYDNGTAVSIGNTSPAGLFSVGATNQFQVGSTGAVTATALNSGAGLVQGTGGLSIGGTVTFTSLTGSSGQCLTTDGSGNLQLITCLTGAGGGSGGVASLNGLSGTLSLSNATGSGSTITINDAKADGSTKGIASFNATNFSAASGIINTVQDIATSASPSFTSLTLSSPLSVASGGTGGSSFVSSVNSQSGTLTFNGTSNQVSVSNTGTTFTFATPQDLATASAVSFGTLDAATLIKTNGTQRIDASGNLSNIGTINASGLIAGGNGLTLSAGTITLNNLTGGVSKCLTLNGSNQVGVSSCATGSGSSPTLQDVYDNSSTTPLINLNTAGKGLFIQDASTPVGGSLFAIKDNTGATNYFAVTTAGASVTGSFSATSLSGNGSAVTNVNAAQLNGQAASYYLNASNINSGTLSDSYLSTNVTLQGNSFNGVNQLVKLDGSGFLPALNGSALTSLNGSNIASGTVADARLSSNVALYNRATSNFTGALQQGGNNVCTTAGNCTGVGGGSIGGSGTVNKIALFTGTGYTIGDSLLSQDAGATTVTVSGDLTVSGAISATSLAGNGSAVTSVDAAKLNGQVAGYYTNATNIASGTLSDSRLSSNVALLNAAANFTGALQHNGNNVCDASNNCNYLTTAGAATSYVQFAPATIQANGSANAAIFINNTGSATNLVQLQNGGIDKFIVTVGGAVTATSFSGDGSNLTNLNGTNVASGTVANARLVNSGSLTVTAGNGLTGGGGVALGASTSLAVGAGSCITVGAGSVAVTGNCVNAAQLGGQAGSYYTNASNINAGTIADTYLSTNVTLQGNTFNGASQLVQLNGSTQLPAVSGALLTSLNGSNISSGTVGTAYGGTGVNGSGATNGQILIGNGSGYSLTTLTAGSGISITNGSGSITIAATAAAGSAGGDLTGTYPNPTVAGIRGTNVSFTSLATGDVLQYDGTNIVNGHVTNTNLTAGTFTNITGTGTLTTGAINWSGNIATTGNITTALSATTGSTLVCQNASNTLSTCTNTYAQTNDITNFIRNQTSAQANANFNIQGASGTVAAVIRGAASQDIIDFKDSSNITVASIDSSGAISATGLTVQSYGTATNLNAINVSSSGSGTANGISISNVGVATSGANTDNGIYFQGILAAANNSYYGLNFADNSYNAILRVNGTDIINGAGVLQSAALSGTYSNGLTLSSTANVYSGTSATLSGTIQGGTFNNTGSTFVVDSSGHIKTVLDATTGTTMVCQNGSSNLSACDATYLAPTATNFIKNTTSQQAGSNFNISGNGTIGGQVNAATAAIGSLGTATGQIYVSGTLPTYLGQNSDSNITTAGRSPVVVGRYLYLVSTGSNKLLVYDISSGTPVYVGQNSDSNLNNVYGLVIQGHYAYAGSGFKMMVYDISSVIPVYVSQNSDSNITGQYNSLSVQGRYVYVTGGGKLVVYDISSGTPVYVGQNSDSNLTSQYTLTTQGRYAYTTNNITNKLVVYDISSGTPVYVGQNSDSNLNGPYGVEISGHYAYVANFTGNKLVVYDISSGTPVYVGQNSDSNMNSATRLSIQGRYAYVSSATSNKLLVYDISSVVPVYIGQNSDTNLSVPRYVTVQGRYAYVVGSTKLYTYDLGGAYIQQFETGGADVGQLSVSGSGSIGGQLSIQSGATIGQNLQVGADAGISGALTVGGSITTGTAAVRGSVIITNGNGTNSTITSTATTAQTFSLPTTGGTLALTSDTANFIRNQTTQQSTGNFNIAAAAGTVAAVFQGAASQEIATFYNSSGVGVFRVGPTGTIGSFNQTAASTKSSSLTLRSGNATGTTSNSGDISVDAGTATGTTGQVMLGATNASAITLGHGTITTAITGNVGITNSGAATTLNLTTNTTPTTGLIVANDTSGTGTDTLINLQASGVAKFTVDASGNVVALGNVTAKTSLIFTDTSATNSITSAAGQGLNFTGNATSTISTTAGDLVLQAAGTNNLTLGTAGAGTVNLGNTNATTVNIGAGTDITRSINIGTGGSTTNQTIVIGSSNNGSVSKLQGGAYALKVSNGGIYIGSSSAASLASADISFGSGASRQIAIQTSSTTTGNSLTINAGGGFTGFGGGNLILQGGAPGSGGTGGSVIIKSNDANNNSNGFFQVQNNDGTVGVNYKATSANLNTFELGVAGGTGTALSVQGNTSQNSKVTIKDAVNSSSALQFGINTQATFNPTGSVTNIYALSNIPKIGTSSNNIGSVYGMYSRTDIDINNYTGQINNLFGLNLDRPNVNVTAANGYSAPYYLGSLTTKITNATQLNIESIQGNDGISGRPTTNKGIDVSLPSNGSDSFTTNYGLFVQGTGATGATNWAIYSNSTANSAIAGSLRVGGTSAPTATIDITGTLKTSGNITVGGHIITSGTAPTIAAGAAACTSPTTVTVSGNDTAGLVTVTTSASGGCTTGIIATVSFNTAFTSAPKVTLTPANANAAALQNYVDNSTISTASFDLDTGSTTAVSKTYRWYYHAFQ